MAEGRRRRDRRRRAAAVVGAGATKVALACVAVAAASALVLTAEAFWVGPQPGKGHDTVTVVVWCMRVCDCRGRVCRPVDPFLTPPSSFQSHPLKTTAAAPRVAAAAARARARGQMECAAPRPQTTWWQDPEALREQTGEGMKTKKGAMGACVCRDHSVGCVWGFTSSLANPIKINHTRHQHHEKPQEEMRPAAATTAAGCSRTRWPGGTCGGRASRCSRRCSWRSGAAWAWTPRAG